MTLTPRTGKSPRPAKALAAATALAASAALCAGCASKTDDGGGSSGKDGDGTFTIGYAQANNAEPYRAQLNKQLAYYVKRHKNLKLLPIADAKQDNARQVSQVQQFIQQKVDVLIVSPNEPDPLTPAVEQACQAKIPVIILDRAVKTDCYDAFIGGDNFQIGKKAGEAAIKALPDGGNVAEIRGLLSTDPQKQRHKGFAAALKGHDDIKVVEQREGKWLQPEGTKIMQQWLQRGTKIDLVYSHNDPMAIGAQSAASGAGKAKDIKFIGIDGLAIPDGGIRAVQQGKMIATYLYPTGAEEAAETAAKLAEGKKVEKKQTLDTTEITKSNAEDVYGRYDMTKKTG
ncbi:D-ribose-binding periplasmic protein precursor [Streptomyces sp. YIM 130001]|uniref:substrate-binding domain-containing protein n=1 Tax=Streptomyces sp. YIM 130001 TaxID=2259644 RepID=UPI000E654626|nr:substrate-binding domain-containing protein [Streptomyces sp. YIM 130001]RII14745.1 D-ribose-binding periplasmic protein precursor [Streptomyces sp. YIM 130001]